MTTIDLATLTTIQGFSISGDASGDQAGISVSWAGDVNGDGIDDFIVGAQFGDDGGTDSGEAYVVFGKNGGLAGIDLSALASTDGFVIQGGPSADRTGFSVSSAGDVNGDGFADLIVGAPFADPLSRGNGGKAFVVFGTADGFGTVDLSALASSDGFAINGKVAGDAAGTSVSAAGDVNGDGFADFIVGARLNADGGTRAGEAYVIFGKADGLGAVDLASLSSSDGFAIQGGIAEGQVGTCVSSAGDINGDGFDDIIIGAPNTRAGSGNDNTGAAFVLFGKADGFADIDLGALASTDGFKIQGDVAGDFAGTSVSSAGDVNGDGFADIIVGARGADDGGSGAGEAFVLFGKASGFADVDLTSLSAADGFNIRGADANDVAGTSVSSAGDVNGDGFDDVIVGAPGNGDGPGKAFVVFGKAGGFANIDLENLSDSDGIVIQGKANGNAAGTSVSSAGDVNGDGIGDLIVGAPSAEGSAANSGAAYVIYGTRPTEAVNRVGSDIGQAIFGGDFDDILSGLGGNDRLDGGGGNDTMIGGTGDDSLVGGAGGDEMEGGEGDDIYTIDDLLDRVIENAGEGSDRVESSVNFSLGAQEIEELLLTGNGKINGTGNGLGNEITGNSAKNVLKGLGGNDRLEGGKGADLLIGGAGKDTFVFNALSDSKASKSGRDTIDDFSHGQRDRIDLTAIDAREGNGNQAFRFIGADDFSDRAGELRFERSGGGAIIEGDVDGDGKADFSIAVSDVTTLVAGDFLL